jgi:predicted Fe-Mo cluster-binding NifX family protein
MVFLCGVVAEVDNTIVHKEHEMIICIGTDGNDIESRVAKRFGHAEYYIIYNTVNKKSESIKNVEGDQHDHNILSAVFARQAKTFIVGNVGPHAFEKLKSVQGNIYLARNMKASEALNALDKGELKELLEPTVKKSFSSKGRE